MFLMPLLAGVVIVATGNAGGWSTACFVVAGVSFVAQFCYGFIRAM